MDSKEAENCWAPPATVKISDTTVGAVGSTAGAYNLVNDEYEIDLTNVQGLLNSTINISGTSATGTVIGGSAAWPNTIYTTTTTGTGGYNWNIGAAPTTISAGGQMELRGERADIKINDLSLCDWMKTVEQRLNILRPNPKLEAEWDELRELGERYRELEKQCQEKSEMWKQLKKMPAPKPDQF